MSIGPAGFQFVSTTTPGKERTIQWQTGIVHAAYGKASMGGKGVSIPGHRSQLERHRDELLSYGIKEDDQIMVDWDHGVARALKAEAARIGFKGRVVQDDLVNVVRTLWANDEQVDVIDFDDTGHLKQYHLDLLGDACKRDVKVFVGVFATRGNSGGLNPFQERLRKRFNIRGYYHQRGNWTYSLRDLQGRAMEDTASRNGYRCQYKGYQGLSTMVSCVVTK